MPYGDYLEKAVWGPMGMTDTRMQSPRDVIPNRVRGYERVDGRLKNSEYVDMSSRFAAGGVQSTVLDLIKFVEGLRANTVLTPESTELMWTSMATEDAMFVGYGLGWNVAPLNGHFRVLHGGSQTGTRTRLTYLPAQDIAIAMASNLERINLAFYEAYLWWLLRDEGWNVRAYLEDERERLVYDAMRAAYQYGLASFERAGGKPRMADREIDGAFAYFNNSVSLSTYGRDPEACKKLVREGANPAGNQRYVALGEYMATQLAERDPESMRRCHSQGAFAFFNDYMNASKRAGNEGRQFEKGFEDLILLWNSSWQRAWNSEMRGLILNVATAAETDQMLRSQFAGATIYPDYARQLTTLCEQAFLGGNPQAGFLLSKLAADLYPKDEQAIGLYGVVLVSAGQAQQGREFIVQAASWNPEGSASADRLLEVSRFFAGGGNPLAAQALLEIAAEVHPDSEEIAAALAEFRSSEEAPAEAPASPGP
jgi:CubicO group peptidase (beta-lactamase class C family)